MSVTTSPENSGCDKVPLPQSPTIVPKNQGVVLVFLSDREERLQKKCESVKQKY